ncbi:hypothetical protein [Acidaminococcus sp.]|uniref:hypothetical protein n=1 Tax=Acidaminococcus sp. TaxID=1872103 RepID=UPI003D7EDE0B
MNQEEYVRKLEARKIAWEVIGATIASEAKVLQRAAEIAKKASADCGHLGCGPAQDVSLLLQDIRYDLESIQRRIDWLEPIYPPKKEGDE